MCNICAASRCCFDFTKIQNEYMLLTSTPRYGVGYHMVIEKAPTCDSIKVVDIVKSLVHGGKCVLDAGAELSFILPSQATASFPSLFEELECMSVQVHMCTVVGVYK